MRTHIIAGLKNDFNPPTDDGSNEEDPLPVDPDDEVLTGNPNQEGQPITKPSSHNPSWIPSKAVKYTAIAAAVQKATGDPNSMGGYDWGAIARWTASGAESGAVGGGWGAIIGAAVGLCIGLFTEQMAQNQQNADEAAGREWVRRYCPQEYFDFMLANGTPSNVIYVTPTVILTKGLLTFWLQKYNHVVVDVAGAPARYYPSEPESAYYVMAGEYSGCKSIYEKAGVDWAKTRVERQPFGTYSVDGTSMGTGGVYMREAKIYRYDPRMNPGANTGGGGGGSTGGGSNNTAGGSDNSTMLIAGAAALLLLSKK